MTEPAAENEAPLLTGDDSGSPVASDVLLHNDEEPLVGALPFTTMALYVSSVLSQQSRRIWQRCS